MEHARVRLPDSTATGHQLWFLHSNTVLAVQLRASLVHTSLVHTASSTCPFLPLQSKGEGSQNDFPKAWVPATLWSCTFATPGVYRRQSLWNSCELSAASEAPGRCGAHGDLVTLPRGAMCAFHQSPFAGFISIVVSIWEHLKHSTQKLRHHIWLCVWISLVALFDQLSSKLLILKNIAEIWREGDFSNVTVLFTNEDQTVQPRSQEEVLSSNMAVACLSTPHIITDGNPKGMCLWS